MDAFAASIHPVPAAWLSNSSLAPFVPDYWHYLIERRYTVATTRSYLYGVAHFARWIHRWRRLAVCDLAEADVQRFLDDHLPRCTCPLPAQRCRHQVRAALRILLAMLDDLGVLAKRSDVAGAIDSELRRLDEHMQHARGLAQSTRTQRLRILRPFFEQMHEANQARPTLRLPTADELRRFIDLQLDRWNPNSARVLAGTLRSYDYRRLRDRVVARGLDMPFFVSSSGSALPARTVENTFSRMRDRQGWSPRGEHAHLRIQDLRHSFATRRVQLWRAAGVSIDQAIFWLCTYLGHAKISDTYWYLTGVPELMAVIGAKFEDFAYREVDHG